MKKFLTIPKLKVNSGYISHIIFVCIFFLGTNCGLQTMFAQTLFNWQHYQKPSEYMLDNGNDYLKTGSEEIFMLNKSTINVTDIPFPPEYRNYNYHNLSYLDTLTMMTNGCSVWFSYGPDNDFILRIMGPCGGNKYLFDGIAFTPYPNFYQGIDIDSVYFIKYKGGSNFFFTQDQKKLFKYDGNTLTYYDSTNSPLNYEANNFITMPNDDLLILKDFKAEVLHNNTWTTYDTGYFGVNNINPGNIETGNEQFFTFSNFSDGKICTYNSNTNSWQNITLPPALNHSNTYTFITSTCYDINGLLWIAGDSIFCNYDGTQFNDFYSTVAGNVDLASFRIMGNIGNNSLFLNDNKQSHPEYIYDIATHTVSVLPADPFSFMPGNVFLPSTQDDSGNVWFGCTDGGLLKLDQNNNWTIPDLYSHGIMGGVLALTRDTGNAIVLGYGDLGSDGPVRIQDTTYTFLNSVVNPYYHRVQSIAIDQNHHYWFGGGGSGVPQQLAEYYNGTLTYHYNPNANNQVYSVAIDNNDHKWVTYESKDGVFEYDGVNWIHYNSNNSPLPNDTVSVIVKEPNSNAIWFCTDGGFAKYDNGNWTLLNTANTILPDNDAENVYFAADSTVWFATRNGFSCLKNNVWETFTTINSPLHNSDIESIIMDQNCTMWFATEFGLSSASKICGTNEGKLITGQVLTSTNVAAANCLINIYKLNAQATDVFKVGNTHTDNFGKFTHSINDTGTYYFQAIVSEIQYPDEITAYSDSAKVIQFASSVQVNNLSFQQINIDIRLCARYPATGNCNFKGRIVSFDQSQITGQVRVVLMKNNQAAASLFTNYDGTFDFRNMDSGLYTLFVDKLGFNNNVAPVININCNHAADVYYFELLPSYLSAIPLNIEYHSDIVNKFQVYPNPTSSIINIISNEKINQEYEISVYDILGKIQWVQSGKFSSSPVQADLSHLTSGIYFLKVNGLIFKVVKQ